MNTKILKKSTIEHSFKNNNKNENRVFARQLTRQLTLSERKIVAGGAVTCMETGPQSDDYVCSF